MVPDEFSLHRAEISDQQLEEGGLADPVGPHDRDTRAQVDTEVHADEQRLLSREVEVYV